MSDGVHGHIVDGALPGGTNLVGAAVHVRGGLAWTSHTGVITSVDGGVNYTVDNAATGGGIAQQLRTVAGNHYYISGALALLDKEGEFFYDHATTTLYVWFDGGSPSDHRISAKMREWAFDFGSASGSMVEGIRLRAASVTMDMTSSNNTLSSIDAEYVSYFVRSVDSPWWGYSRRTGLRLWGTGHTIKDSAVRYSAGSGINLQGNNHTVSNNLITFMDYAGDYDAPILIRPDDNGVVSGHQMLHNTIATTGRDAINYIASASSGDAWRANAFVDGRIAFNEISDFGRLTTDLGGIYMCCGIDGTRRNGGQVVSRAMVDHNSVHDSAGAGIYFDNGDHGFVITHNVLWNNVTAGVQLNGFTPDGNSGNSYDFTINSNTFFYGQPTAIYTAGELSNGLSTTYITNNIFVVPSGVRTGCGGGICSGASDLGSGGGNNFYGNPGFVNGTVAPYDFRLYGGNANSCSGTAAAMWTDTAPVYDTCPTGAQCATPVAPSFGAFNTGGYVWSFGTSIAH
jgi:hypothetical protein